MKKITSFALLQLAGAAALPAAVSDNLIAYYNFEETGTSGIANKVPGSATHGGSFGNANAVGATLAFGAGPGFAGSAAFEGAESANTTNRSSMLVGKALNIAKSDASATAGSGWFTVNSLTGGGLAPNFTISGWFFIAPDADNGGTDVSILRDFVFEGNSNFDVSFGTNTAAGLAFQSYVGQTSHSNTAELTTGQWYHIVHVFSQNGANTELRVYLNGTQVGGVVAAPTANMDFVGINFGANRDGQRIFDGMLDEFAVWNRALTSTEVTELRNLGLAGTPLVNSVTVTLANSPTGAGTTSGGGVYNTGANVSISATANPGYVFDGWDGDFTGRAASFTYTANASASGNALFAEDTADSDGDGLSNYQEVVVYQTLPNNPDSDGDLIPDGAEVNTTGTNPKSSDSVLVNFVQQNLSTGSAGRIALSPLRLERDPGTGAISLFLSLKGSATQGAWQDIDLNSPSASIVPSGDGWNLSFPAPSSSVNSYLVVPNQP